MERLFDRLYDSRVENCECPFWFCYCQHTFVSEVVGELPVPVRPFIFFQSPAGFFFSLLMHFLEIQFGEDW